MSEGNFFAKKFPLGLPFKKLLIILSFGLIFFLDSYVIITQSLSC